MQVDGSGASPTDGPVDGPTDAAGAVAALERVELEARERRLAAQADAEEILAAAAEQVAAIEARVDARTKAALASLRERIMERATAEIAELDHDRPTAAQGGQGSGDGSSALAAAADLVVAAVLGESWG